MKIILCPWAAQKTAGPALQPPLPGGAAVDPTDSTLVLSGFLSTHRGRVSPFIHVLVDAVHVAAPGMAHAGSCLREEQDVPDLQDCGRDWNLKFPRPGAQQGSCYCARFWAVFLELCREGRIVHMRGCRGRQGSAPPSRRSWGDLMGTKVAGCLLACFSAPWSAGETVSPGAVVRFRPAREHG